MTRDRSHAGSPPPSHGLDRVVEVLLVGLVAFLALSFGGVLDFSQLLLSVATLVMVGCLGLRCLLSRQPVSFSWALLPVVLFLGLVAFQLVALPMEGLAALSPETARWWTQLLEQPALVGGTSQHATISLYPDGTWRYLRLISCGAVILFVASNVLRNPRACRRVLGGVTLVGGVVIVLALAQMITDASQIYWTFDAPGRTAGPFVHPGHFSQFVNLTMGAAFGLWLVRASDRQGGAPLELEPPGAASNLDRLLLAFLVLGVVTIAVSLSRNGLISAVFAGAATAALLQGTRTMDGIGWPLIAVLLCGFVVLLFFGVDPVYDRMATLSDPKEAYSARWDLLVDSVSMAGSFPLLGIGQGTFAVVFPMFDSAPKPRTAEHAENQYAEQLVETGVVGVALLALAIGFLVWSWLRMVRKGRTHEDIAGFGLGFGLLALAVHATTDFGITTPAIGILAVIFAGMILARTAPFVSGKLGARGAGAAVSFACCTLLAWMLPGAWNAYRAEALWRRVEGLHQEMGVPLTSGTREQYEELVAKAERAAELQPGNVEYRFWAPIHRWSAVVAEASGYERLAPGELEHTPELVAAAARTRDELSEVRRIAPTYGPLWSVVGQLGLLWLDDPQAGEWIHRGRELAPHHPATCLASALQSMREGDDEGAQLAFQQAIEMRAHPAAVLDMLVFEFDRSDMGLEIARGDLRWLTELERMLKNKPDEEGLLALVRVEAREQLEASCRRADAQPWMFERLAYYAAEAGDDEVAIANYRNFLIRKPESTTRYNLARVLVRAGREDEARRHLQDLLSIRPDHKASQALLDRLDS